MQRNLEMQFWLKSTTALFFPIMAIEPLSLYLKGTIALFAVSV
jgi:hypothetical protein